MGARDELTRTSRLPDEGRRRAVIDHVLPNVDHGRFPIKRVVGDILRVEADAFPDGHDHITVRHRIGWRHQHLPNGDHLWISVLGHRYTTSGRSP